MKHFFVVSFRVWPSNFLIKNEAKKRLSLIADRLDVSKYGRAYEYIRYEYTYISNLVYYSCIAAMF